MNLSYGGDPFLADRPRPPQEPAELFPPAARQAARLFGDLQALHKEVSALHQAISLLLLHFTQP